MAREYKYRCTKCHTKFEDNKSVKHGWIDILGSKPAGEMFTWCEGGKVVRIRKKAAA